MHPLFFTELLMLLVIATAVAIAFEKFRLPAILGFLLAGVIIGPQGLGILSNGEHIRSLAELGVVLLMLTIGLEFSFDRLRGMQHLAIVGGTLQILISIGLSLMFAWWRKWSFYEGFFLGSVIALSSTAIVLKYLIDRGEIDTPHGRIAISILIFQDLAVVPLMIFLTAFGQSEGAVWAPLGSAFLKTVLLLAGAFVCSRFLLPQLLFRVAVIRNREVFFLFSVVVCLGMAWISGALGLSVAIGALLAGFMFANTGFSHQLIGDIIPFRHLFVSIFFVSLGLLFDLRFFVANMPLVLLVVSLVLFVNFVIMTLLIMAFGFPPRVAMVTGIMLSQIGEFSFVLIQMARGSGHISHELYQILLSTAFLTMLLTPLLFASIPSVLKFLGKFIVFGVPPRNWAKPGSTLSALTGHVILCGFGPTGRDLANAFKEEEIPFVILEMNPQKVQEAKKLHLKAVYGDAANREVMRRVGILRARAVVVSFPDILGITQIIRVVQELNPEVLLAVRTRYEGQTAALYELGADIVVMEEWEASHELNRVVLEQLRVPPGRIEHHLGRIRARKEMTVEEAIFRRMSKEPINKKTKSERGAS
ncbi:MAG TPA: cation:proton antiporter [Candidatus Omnitrophota bacterium]|nr:cation:proton antiporter [Candidatus Omnitrophota bacterium]HPS36925.1 cation:proton antiporter [Candidatus Omnitrophota bacterium]